MKKLFPVLFCIMLLVVSCGMIKAPAELAIKTAEESLKTVRTEAAQFVPEQLADIEAALSAAKKSFEKGEYKTALATAKDLPLRIKDLAAAIEAKKAELPQNWTELSTELPKLIAGTKAAVAKVKDADKAVLEAAKTGVDEMNSGWKEAQASFKDGKLAEAVIKAREIKAKAAQIMTSLGLAPVETAKK